MRRPALLLSVLAFAGCAVAQDPDATPSIFGDASSVSDTGSGGGDDTSKPADSSVADTATSKPDTTTTAEDTFAPPVDTAVADTSKPPADTSVADTFVPPTDTGSPTTDGGACAIQGCSTGSQDRLSCATARTISRRTAGPLGGYNATITLLPTTSIYDATSLTCIAAGGDQAYKIFARKGEVITATATDASDGGSSTYTVVMFESLDCTTNVCAGTPKKCAASSATITATGDGWVSIVVSGQTPFDFGSYSIKVTLAGCKTTDCECP